MNTETDYTDLAHEGRALVAVFPDRDRAREAIARLHDEGFHRPWLGVTRSGTTSSGETEVETDDTNAMGAIGRFFTGESGGHSLHKELIRHGISEGTALRLDSTLPPNSCILTVDGANHPELAAEVIESAGGHIVGGEGFDRTDGSGLRQHASGAAALGYGDADTMARGESIDEERRLRLREERLSVNKERVSAGEATVGKEVVSHEEAIDVPVYHEELFIENRPASGRDDVDTTPIGEGDVIHIPLTEEHVQVSKRIVQTGEVVFGKRRVEETEHVRDTIREERLRVDDGRQTAGVTPDRNPNGRL